MTRAISKRAYDASSRRKSAEGTRQSIIDAARGLFLDKGYAATTMPAIAQAAGIALDTVYATVGKKATLFRLLIEMAISGSDRAVPAEERDYVRAIREEADAARKLHLYAGAVSRIQSRLAPLFRVLQGAAPLDPELDALWQGIARAPGQEHAVAGQGAGGNRTPPAGPLGRQSGRHHLEHEFVGVLSPPGRTARLVGRRVRALAGRRVGSVIAKDMSSRTR